jgi:rhamnosyltransferase
VKNFKVLAYITAYEDHKAVETCITALKNQSSAVEKILIVDNSTRQSILLSNYENVIIKHHPENLGVAGGFQIALEMALKEEYDFLWTFDQDSVPAPDCLKILLEEYNQLSQAKYKVGIIAPTSIDCRTHEVVEAAIFVRDRFTSRKHISQEQPYECDAPITSGSLISIAAAKSIPPPRTELFIDGVDFDFGMCLKQNGFHNLIVPQAILEHKFGNPIKVRFFYKERFVQKYSALRHYYICRNHTYLETRYAKGLYRFTSCLQRLRYMMRTIVLTILYDHENKTLKIWACLLGTYHGLKGKLGKNWH